MDSDYSINNPLLYPHPMCSSLNMLADIATGLHNQDTSSSIPSLKIRFNIKYIQTLNEAAIHQPSISIKFMPCHDLPSTSKNPFNFMGSAIEKGAPLNDNDDDDADFLIRENKRRALKGKSVAVINHAENDDILDFLDQDWVPSKPSPNKSLGSSSCKRKRQRLNIVVEAAAPSELPQEFKDKINELGGNEITLLITKSLFDSDLNGQQNRLSIPSKKIKNVNFLREGEVEDLEGGKGKEVKLIQPSLEVTNLTLAKWNMHKKNGRCSSSYVLRSSSWKKVIKANDLKVNDRVQVWSFRVQEELCMALVKV